MARRTDKTMARRRTTIVLSVLLLLANVLSVLLTIVLSVLLLAYNGQKKDRQYNGQKKKHRQYNGQKKD
jgi:cell division protein FtsB